MHMRRKILAATTLPLWLTMTVLSQAAMNTVDRLIHAAYFSDACRSEAAALGIVATADADSLFAAFARQVAAPPGAGRPDVLGDECKAPPVLLINLLRGNGIDAALAFISMLRTNAAGEIEPSGKIDRVIVYVPAVNRYLDPSAPPAKQAVLDAIIREQAARTLLHGPSLAAGRDACSNTCMEVISGGGADAVRVKTETIRR